MEPISFIAGVVATRLAERGTELTWRRASGLVRPSSPVRRALRAAVEAGVDAATAEVYRAGPRAEAARRALLERDEQALPLVDGTPLTELVPAVRQWVGETETPPGDRAPAPAGAGHPLVAPLCVAILTAVCEEATRGEGVLERLWNDFRHQQTHAMARTRGDATGAPMVCWDPPGTTAGFVGRGRALADLADLVDPGGSTTLIGGIGGIGKTALAIACAERDADQYPDGRIFYDFRSYSVNRAPATAGEALREILPRVLGDDMPVERAASLDDDELAVEWRRAASGRRLIMVWDNVGSIDQVAPLLVRRDGCSTIVTSRAHLDLDASRELWLEAMTAEDAASLFTAIAGPAHDPDQVNRLVEADVGLPVLIDSHARVVKSGRRSLDELLHEIATMPRTSTRYAVFARLLGSYRTLDVLEQYAFRAMGAHPGGFLTADTAAAVMDCALDEAVEILDSLCAVGLADPYRAVEAAPDRRLYAYTSRDIVRDYAAELARSEPDEHAAMTEALLRHYRTRVDAYTPGELPWLRAEAANVVAAVRSGSSDAHAALGAAAGALLIETNRFDLALHVYRHLAALHEPRPESADYALALCGIGHALRLQGGHDRARDHFGRAARIAEALGNDTVLAEALEGLGDCSGHFEDVARARECFSEAAALRHCLGHVAKEAMCLWRLGILETTDGDRPAAEDRYRRAMALYEQAGNERGRADVMRSLARVHLQAGELEQTHRLLRAALSVYEEYGDDRNRANATWALGEYAIAAGSASRGLAHLETALGIYERLGMRSSVEALRRQIAEHS